MSFAQFLTLVLETLRHPEIAAARVCRVLAVPGARGLAFGAVIAISASLGLLAEVLFSFTTGLALGQSVSPLVMALVQGGLMLYGAFVMALMGRQFGGQGSFGDALSLLIWMQAVLIAGQGVQLALMVLFPILAVLLSLVLIALMFWLLVRFTAALHGFDNLMMVGAGVLVVFFGSALLFGVILLSLGISPPFTPMPMEG